MDKYRSQITIDRHEGCGCGGGPERVWACGRGVGGGPQPDTPAKRRGPAVPPLLPMKKDLKLPLPIIPSPSPSPPPWHPLAPPSASGTEPPSAPPLALLITGNSSSRLPQAHVSLFTVSLPVYHSRPFISPQAPLPPLTRQLAPPRRRVRAGLTTRANYKLITPAAARGGPLEFRVVTWQQTMSGTAAN